MAIEEAPVPQRVRRRPTLSLQYLERKSLIYRHNIDIHCRLNSIGVLTHLQEGGTGAVLMMVDTSKAYKNWGYKPSNGGNPPLVLTTMLQSSRTACPNKQFNRERPRSDAQRHRERCASSDVQRQQPFSYPIVEKTRKEDRHPLNHRTTTHLSSPAQEPSCSSSWLSSSLPLSPHWLFSLLAIVSRQLQRCAQARFQSA